MFTPPFCPNELCDHHQADQAQGRWFYRIGYHHSKAFGAVPRFRCRRCGITFSRQTFRLDYYVKRPLSYRRIFEHLCSGSGVRSTARWLQVSHHAVSNRIGWLSRQALALQAQLMHGLQLSEDLVADGFESFVCDQYQPNNIHLLVGSRSQFLYCFNYAHLRRKGRMTDRQKAERERRERRYIRERISITDAFVHIADEVEQLVSGRTGGPTTLFTDKKREYLRVIGDSQGLHCYAQQGRFTHKSISSHKPRTTSNPLFPVNYLDRQLRKDNANHVRQTVQFSRSVGNCLERIAVYQLYHNYLKPFRVDDSRLSGFTHAEMAGVRREEIERQMQGLFSWRKFFSHLSLSWSQLQVWARMVGPLQRWDGQYQPGYVLT